MAVVDGGYSSIITAESLARDKVVLTVEPEYRKHIKTIVIRCKKMRKMDEVLNDASETITG